MSLVLNGTSQYLSLASSLVAAGVPCTIAAWMKPAATTTGQTLVGFGSTANFAPFILMAVNATAAHIGAQQRDDTGANGVAIGTSTAAFSTGVWSHAAAVFASASSRSGYINGAGKGTNTTTENTTTTNTSAIGALIRSTAGGFFAGKLAHVGVWAMALSDAEIASLASGALPSTIEAASLVAYAPLTADFTDAQGNSWTNNGSATIDATDNPTMLSTGTPRIWTGAGLVQGDGVKPKIWTGAGRVQ